MKTRLIRLILIGMVLCSVTSCGLMQRDGKKEENVPNPTFLEEGNVAPYSGWLVHENLLVPSIKEAGPGR